MSIAKNASRFDFLTDDADDPFQTGSKKNKKKDGSGTSADASKKKAAKKGNANSDRKQLQSLAFGSVSEGKKKSKGSCQTQPNGNSLTGSIDGSEHSKEQRNGNSSEKCVGNRPQGISDEQWDEWQKRDVDFMDETYVSELQTALLQSKIQFETEQTDKPLGKGKKKKPLPVSLSEFNARLSEGGPSIISNNVMNGTLNHSSFGNHNQQFQQQSDEDLVEKFRMEAKLEIERERQKLLERQLLMSRQPPPPIARPTPVSLSSPTEGLLTIPVDDTDKDMTIERLTKENLQLKNEVEMLRNRVKTINIFLEQAQEVKDKAKLVYELDKATQFTENLTKANCDLNEDVRQLHSQLEQEKSRSSAAMLELRRLLENRRRTATEGSNS